jgi:alkylation response protein AidB-like acyl-CoA dehydrogenase
MTTTPDITATTSGTGLPTAPASGNVRDVADTIGRRLTSSVRDADATGTLSRDAFEALRAGGLTTALVPAEYGGGGATHAEMGAALRALGRHDPATAVTLSMHSHLVALQVWRHRHGMDAAAFFERVAAGCILVSTGASDWVGSNGTVQKVDGGYRVNGRKSPASGCEVADIAVTSFRWEETGPAQVIHCAVPMSADGVRIEHTWDTLGLRATGSHTIVFDDVFVPDGAVSLVRSAAVWHPIWNAVLGAALPLIMAAYAGIADAAVDIALELAGGRAEEHVAQLAGEMLNAHTTGVDAIDAMFHAADDLRFEGTDAFAARALSRKTVAAESLIATVRLAIEATGGAGYTRGCDLERLYRDVHGSLFHPLPRAKQTKLSGRVALGLPPV